MRFDSGPEYPLTREQFRHALCVGHGRALVHVELHGAQDVREDILDAALTCHTYDPQLNRLCAGWLARFCVVADLVREVVERPPAGDDWDRRQRCALLKEFALLGHEQARPALYAACEKSEKCADVFACDEIIGLDGEAGLVFVARKLGELLATGALSWRDDDALVAFDERHAPGAAHALLLGLAESDAAIECYLAAVRAQQASSAHRQQQPRAREPVEDVLAAIRSADRSLARLYTWGRKATEEELARVLPLALSPGPALVLENALRCLAAAKNPPIDDRLFGLLEHESWNVRSYCAALLGRHAAPRIRTAGLALLASDFTMGTKLLRKSGLPEDAAAVVAALAPFSDVDEQHEAVWNVIDLWRQNEGIRDPRLALYVYTCSPCRMCRGDAVMKLDEWGVCPAWLVAEGVHDADDEVRERCVRLAADAALRAAAEQGFGRDER